MYDESCLDVLLMVVFRKAAVALLALPWSDGIYGEYPTLRQWFNGYCANDAEPVAPGGVTMMIAEKARGRRGVEPCTAVHHEDGTPHGLLHVRPS